jgi:hypothetical protein
MLAVCLDLKLKAQHVLFGSRVPHVAQPGHWLRPVTELGYTGPSPKNINRKNRKNRKNKK